MAAIIGLMASFVSTPTFAASGGVITTDGSYTVHTFTTTANFVVSIGSRSIEYLIVAGGGGGGTAGGGSWEGAGGGGAGGMLTGTTTASSATGTYVMTVGAGGPTATAGANSSAFGVTATGGGRGGTFAVLPSVGGNGGSGGGGYGYTISNPGGTGVAGQGNAGGTAPTGTGNGNVGGGGGGGKAAVGSNSVAGAFVGAAGGAGQIWPSGGSTYYAGGGGGGAGITATATAAALGGGGVGQTTTAAATPGTINTGGGGGGGKAAVSGNVSLGAAGGSGVIIVRYLTDDTFVTDGLVLRLDAGNESSYQGSGTTWYDLSGNGNNGTLTNGPTYNSANGGSIVFDGTNDYINLGNILNYTTENFTFNTFFYLNSFTTSAAGQGPQLFWKGSYNANGYYCAIGSGGDIFFHTNQAGASQFSYTNSGRVTTGVWYNLSIVRTGSSVRIYINGVDVTDFPATHINPTSSTGNLQLGAYDAGFIYSNHRVATFQSYSRALSAAEIQQNFNATKSRYGL